MDSIETFVYRTHSRTEGVMPTATIGKTAAQDIVRRVDDGAMAALAEAAKGFLPAVLDEIEELERARVHSPSELARRAFLFGIATPNRDEAASLGWALAAAPSFGKVSPTELSETRYQSLRTGSASSRMGLRHSLVTALEDIYAQFDDLAPEELTPDSLEVVRGIGPKVARMVTAIANPHADVWTVDLWHIRQLLWAGSSEYRVRASLDARAYPILERRWLEYRDEFFPRISPFAAQWATWNVADGRHNSHRVLWADLVKEGDRNGPRRRRRPALSRPSVST